MKRFLLASVLAVLALVAIVTSATATVQAPSASSPCHNGTTTAITHVVVIYEENESYQNVIGSSSAPYENQLASQCGVATNLHNVSHPSLPNYIGSTSGQETNCAINSDSGPGSCPQAQQNLFHELNAAGKRWRTYAEGMPSNCDKSNTGTSGTGSGYAVRHNPAPYYTDLGSSGDGSCAKYDVPLASSSAWGPVLNAGALKSDVTNGTLPAVSIVVPNLCDDGHSNTLNNCSTDHVADIDKWLKVWVPFILNGSNYTAANTDVAIVYDEGKGSDYATGEKCWDATHANSTSYPSCHVLGLFIGPKTQALKSSTDFNLYDFLNAVTSISGVAAFPGNSTTGTPTGHSIRSTFGW